VVGPRMVGFGIACNCRRGGEILLPALRAGATPGARAGMVAGLARRSWPQAPREPAGRPRQGFAFTDVHDPTGRVSGNVVLFVVSRLWGRLIWIVLLNRRHQ
jgi:hypothetical protein